MNVDLFERYNKTEIISYQKLQEQKKISLSKMILPYIKEELEYNFPELCDLKERELNLVIGEIGYHILKEFNIENENLYHLKEKIARYNQLQQLREAEDNKEENKDNQQQNNNQQNNQQQNQGNNNNQQQGQQPRQNFLQRAGAAIKGGVQSAAQTVGQGIKSVGGAALNFGSEVLKGAGSSIMSGLKNIGGGILEKVGKFLPAIIGVIGMGLFAMLGLKNKDGNINDIKAQLQQAQAGQDNNLSQDINHLMSKAKTMKSAYAQQVITQLSPVSKVKGGGSAAGGKGGGGEEKKGGGLLSKIPVVGKFLG